MEGRVLRTEAPRLYITLFTGGRIRVRVAQRGPCTDLQILVQTPLFRAGEAWLGRLVWDVQTEDGGIFPKAYTCHSNGNEKKYGQPSSRSFFCGRGTDSKQWYPHLQKLVASHLLSAEAVGS